MCFFGASDLGYVGMFCSPQYFRWFCYSTRVLLAIRSILEYHVVLENLNFVASTAKVQVDMNTIAPILFGPPYKQKTHLKSGFSPPQRSCGTASPEAKQKKHIFQNLQIMCAHYLETQKKIEEAKEKPPLQ